MPMYTYRREDGTTFEIRQKFADAPLTVDPESGQSVKRVVQASGIIFKGSGFYVTDNRGAARSTNTTSSTTTSTSDSSAAASSAAAAE